MLVVVVAGFFKANDFDVYDAYSMFGSFGEGSLTGPRVSGHVFATGTRVPNRLRT